MPPVGFLQRDDGIHRLGQRPEGLAISQDKGHGHALFQGEIGHRMHILAADFGAGAEGQQMRPRHRRHGAAVAPRDPGNGHAIIEADRQLGMHGDAARHAFHDADDAAFRRARRHEIGHLHLAGGRGEERFQDQAVAAIAPGGGELPG